MNPLELIPDEGDIGKLCVLVTVLNIGKALVLINFIMLLILVHSLVLVLAGTFNKLALEPLHHGVEVASIRSKNGKLAVVNWVELGLAVLSRFAWKLGLGLDGELLVVFDIVHRDAEVRNSTNH